MTEGMQSPTIHAITAQNSLLPIIKHPLPSDMAQRQVVRRCLLGLQKHKHKPKIAILDVSLDEMPQATPNLKHNELKKNDVGKLLLNVDCVKATCLCVAAK